MYRVILVDDEPYGIEGLRMLIDWDKHHFMIADTCESGEEALAAIVQHLPHLVVTDIRMPGMDGLQLIEQARKLAGLEVQPIFAIMSGYHDFQYARQALHMGVTHYFTKPILSEEVDVALIAIRKALADQERERERDRQVEAEVFSFIECQDTDIADNSDTSMQAIEQYVRDHYREPLTIKEIAERYHYNAAYLGQALAKHLGKSLLEYIHDLRIEEAERLLCETELPNIAIAETVGYTDYSKFIKQFVKRFGMKPSEYKQRDRPTPS